MSELKIEAIVYEINKGQVISLQYNGELFYKTKSSSPSKPVSVDTNLKYLSDEELSKRRGKLLVNMGNNNVYENVYNHVVESYEKGKSRKEMLPLFSVYYPKSKTESLQVYYNLYKRYWQSQGKQSKTVYHSVPRKYNKRKPKDSIGYDKTYLMYIKQDEYNKVKQAIHSFGFIATVKSIVEKTGLNIQHVRGIVHYMLKKSEIYKTLDSNLQPIYHPAITGTEQV